VGGGKTKEEFVKFRTERDAQLDMPKLIIPSLQVNMRAGEVPTDKDGNPMLKVRSTRSDPAWGARRARARPPVHSTRLTQFKGGAAMDARTLSAGLTVSPQITPEDVADLAKQGIRTIICNRPDGEADGQPSFARIDWGRGALSPARSPMRTSRAPSATCPFPT
jgi:hypothetical protein